MPATRAAGRTDMAFQQRLDASFYATVQEKVRQDLDTEGLDGIILDHPDDVAYLTGLFHHPCERPVVVYVGRADPTVLLVPELEREHAQWQEAAAEVVTYPEYPGVVEPLTVLSRAI